MFRASLIEMTKGRWREFCREPSAMFFVILMPIVWMILLGVMFSSSKTEHYRIGLALANFTESSQSKVVSLALEADHSLTVLTDSLSVLKNQLKRNNIALIVNKIDENGVQFIFDPSNPQSIQAKRLVSDRIQTALGRQDVIAISDQPQSMPGGRYVDFLIPGLLALSLLTTSLFGTGMTIVANRRENLLKRYCVTPMKFSDYILSHIIGRYLIAVVETITILSAGFVLFDFHIYGSKFDFFLLILLGTGAFTAIGILAGSKTKNTSAYNGMVNLLSLPMMLLAGVWFSKTYFPSWLADIAQYLPLTALVDALRSIALEGATLGSVSFEILVLLGYGIASAVTAGKIFRWY